MRRWILVAALIGLLAGLTVPAIASSLTPPTTKARTLVATLTGSGETPAVVSAGVGHATITIDKSKNMICYEVHADGIADQVAMHIHKAPAGVNGGVVVALDIHADPTATTSQGCRTDVKKSLLRDIKDFPAEYYVNVHTATNPGGELRGQLARIR